MPFRPQPTQGENLDGVFFRTIDLRQVHGVPDNVQLHADHFGEFDVEDTTTTISGITVDGVNVEVQLILEPWVIFFLQASAVGATRGDMNLDGEVNGLDVDPFVDALLSGPYQTEADMNEDQVVNGLDVDPFVAAVVGGVQRIPEPSTLLLAIVALGLAGGWRKWKRAA